MHAFVCESCGFLIYSESRELPSCPVCRGMMVAGEDKGENGQKWTCGKCGYAFFTEGKPFKCPLCDESFYGGKYF